MANRNKTRRINYLRRVIVVQEKYQTVKNEVRKSNGITLPAPTDRWIYENIIAVEFHISESTFRNMLGIRARQELTNFEGS